MSEVEAPPSTLRGIGVSAGSAVGPAVLVGPAPTVPRDEPGSVDPEADWQIVAEAIEEVAAELDKRAVAAGGAGADILTATAMMARDPGLGKAIRAALQAGRGRAGAVHTATEQICEQFAALGGYLAERTTDLRDVAARVIAVVLGLPAPGVPALTRPAS